MTIIPILKLKRLDDRAAQRFEEKTKDIGINSTNERFFAKISVMISRTEIIDYIKKQYDAEPDYPWLRLPNYVIFRHKHNRKWFAGIFDITEDKLGLPSDKPIDTLIIKSNPFLIGSLRKEQGVFPAYHMNKEHWISVHLGIAKVEEVYALLDISYGLTK